MGVEVYIIKSKEEEAFLKILKIDSARRETFDNAVHLNGMVLLTDEQQDYIYQFNPDIEWVKYNHITAWLAKNVFGKRLDENPIGYSILDRQTLILLCQECKKVLKRCEIDGQIKVDRNYCRKIFPHLNYKFSGNAEYDESFIEEIRTAKQDIERLLLTSSVDDVFVLFVDA